MFDYLPNSQQNRFDNEKLHSRKSEIGNLYALEEFSFHINRPKEKFHSALQSMRLEKT